MESDCQQNRLDQQNQVEPRITFILPTNKPHVLFEHALSASSLSSLMALKNKAFSFVLSENTFSIMDLAEIRQRMINFDIPYRHQLVTQETPVRLARLRSIAASAFPRSEYFMFADDNMEWSSGTDVYHKSSGGRYSECLFYLDHMTRCGGVACVGPLGGNHSRWKIRPTNKMWYTDRGLIFRNAFEGKLFHPEALELAGGFDDPLPGFKLLEKGYYIAKQFNNPTRHFNRLNVGHGDVCGEDDHQMHSRDLVGKIERYIMDRYQATQPFRQNPSEGMGFYPPLRLLELYYANGGPKGIYPKVTTEDLDIDFEGWIG